MPDDLILSAALPTVAARPDGRVVIASSALTASGAFYDIAERGRLGDQHVRTFRRVAKVADGAEDAPWISPSSDEAARAAMSEIRFAAEYQAAWGGTGDAWIPRTVLERVIVDLPLLTLADNGGNGCLRPVGVSSPKSPLASISAECLHEGCKHSVRGSGARRRSPTPPAR